MLQFQKFRLSWKRDQYFLPVISKSENFIYARLLTCKLKCLKHFISDNYVPKKHIVKKMYGRFKYQLYFVFSITIGETTATKHDQLDSSTSAVNLMFSHSCSFY